MISMGMWVPIAELFAHETFLWDVCRTKFNAVCDNCGCDEFYEIEHRHTQNQNGYRCSILLKKTFPMKTVEHCDDRIIMCAKCGIRYVLKTNMFAIDECGV